MENNDHKQLHIAMFPWLAFGHMYPALEVAKFLAQKGHFITFVSTPRNIDRLPQVPPSLAPNINFVKLPLLQEHRELLPENAESTMDIPPQKVPHLFMAYNGLQASATELLKSITPDWMIADFAAAWLPVLAHSLNIPVAFFSVCASWNLGFLDTPNAQLGSDAAGYRKTAEDFKGPPKWVPFQSKIGLKYFESKKKADNLKKSDDLKAKDTEVKVSFPFNQTISSCDMFLFRTSKELEPEWLNHVSAFYKKPVFPVLIPPLFHIKSEEEEDNTDWLKIKDWLDKQKPKSVVYIALGSELRLSQEDLTELALGLELSGLPFFWALRKQQDSDVEMPDGFEERTKDRGIVWKGWVPQLKILAHHSLVGCLTHCGWGSVVEGLQCGHVLVMLPYLLDQSLCARVLEEKEVGIEIPRNEDDGSFTRKQVADTLKMAMVDEEGSVYRENAEKMGKLFSDRDLHEQSIENLIQYLKKTKTPLKNSI